MNQSTFFLTAFLGTPPVEDIPDVVLPFGSVHRFLSDPNAQPYEIAVLHGTGWTFMVTREDEQTVTTVFTRPFIPPTV